MKHTASTRFWALYDALPKPVQTPQLPGVLAYGDSANDAMAKAQILALRVLAERLEHNETGPQAITVTLAA